MFEGRPGDVVAEPATGPTMPPPWAAVLLGGIPAAAPNPSESTGLQYTNSKPGGLLTPGGARAAGMPVVNLSAARSTPRR